MQRTCEALGRSLSASQMREQRWILTRQFVCMAAHEQPSWQQSADLALSRTALPQARALALGALAQYYGGQSVLVLLRLITDRSETMAIRMFAAGLLAGIEAPAADFALLRAINDNATDQVIQIRVDLVRKLADAGIPNNLRLLLCSEAIHTSHGRRVLEKIWRSPEQYANAWAVVAVLLLIDDASDKRLTEVAAFAANTALSSRVRMLALQVLYTLRSDSRTTTAFPPAAWDFIRQIWARDGGDVKRAAGELLKLQGR